MLITVFRSNSSPQDGPKSGSSLGSLTIQQATFKPTFKLSNKRSNFQTNFQTNLQTFKQTFKLSNQLSNQPSNFQTNFQTFKPTFKARACVTRVVQRSCQAREHKKYILPPRTMSCCNSLTVMYMNLVLGVYSKALLQDSCSHQWPLGKFPHSQLCCRHLRPDPYNDSHCVAAPVRYDKKQSSSSTCSEDKKAQERAALLYPTYIHESALCAQVTQAPNFSCSRSPRVCTLRPGPVSKKSRSAYCWG